jgi:hypothetical protein
MPTSLLLSKRQLVKNCSKRYDGERPIPKQPTRHLRRRGDATTIEALYPEGLPNLVRLGEARSQLTRPHHLRPGPLKGLTTTTDSKRCPAFISSE